MLEDPKEVGFDLSLSHPNSIPFIRVDLQFLFFSCRPRKNDSSRNLLLNKAPEPQDQGSQDLALKAQSTDEVLEGRLFRAKFIPNATPVESLKQR